jgi:hypothetical protein
MNFFDNFQGLSWKSFEIGIYVFIFLSQILTLESMLSKRLFPALRIHRSLKIWSWLLSWGQRYDFNYIFGKMCKILAVLTQIAAI